jgi:nucleoside-diphosphate-sugar epimerase
LIRKERRSDHRQLVTGNRHNLEEIAGDFDFIEGDLNDDDALQPAIWTSTSFSSKRHCPAFRVPSTIPEKPSSLRQCDVQSSVNARSPVCAVIYAASSSAYGDQPTLPKGRDDESRSVVALRGGKLMGEYYCRVFNQVTDSRRLSLRYFNVFGPRQDPSSTYSALSHDSSMR